MNSWSSGNSVPESYTPCLCSVLYRDGPAWEVLYYHPRKGWIFRDGLALSPSASVVQWVAIDRVIKQPLQ